MKMKSQCAVAATEVAPVGSEVGIEVSAVGTQIHEANAVHAVVTVWTGSVTHDVAVCGVKLT